MGREARPPMKDYYEDLWQRLPDQLTPPDLDLRAGFLLGEVRAGQQILDLGCGDGAFSELISQREPDVAITAAEVAEAALERVRSRPRLPATVACVLVPLDGELPFSDNRFDLIWASEVIEHVADTGRWLSEVRRVLVPGGTLLLTTPDHTRLRLALRGIGHYSPPLGDHLHLYDRHSLAELLGDFGFGDLDVRALRRFSGLLGARARR